MHLRIRARKVMFSKKKIKNCKLLWPEPSQFQSALKNVIKNGESSVNYRIFHNI